MKKIKNIYVVFFSLAITLFGCQENDYEFGQIISPSNINITTEIVGVDALNPNGDGSGVVNFTATANNAVSYKFVFNGGESVSLSGKHTISASILGLNTYTITVVASGTAGISASKSIQFEVLSTYSPPADLTEMLHANSSRTWKIASDIQDHFGLGNVGNIPFQHYGAAPGDKAASGMYDDKYTFNVDGTFTHDVGPDGFVFGRDPLINELGGSGGNANGADIEQYIYGSYTANWSLSAPGGDETISLTGIGFVGYYVGGNHKYIIHSRSANEMVIKTTDGNGQFDWWFRLVAE